MRKFFLLVFFASSFCAQAQVDSVVTRLMRKAGVTGLCLGIVKDNQVSYVKAYGYKNKPRGQMNDTATCFYGASLSKAVFAYVVMKLVDSSIIALDTPLYRYLPKPLPQYGNYMDLAGDDRWKLLTARHCLDHTTGFPNWRFFNPNDNSKLEFFFTPGERYAYSGEGLALLQFVIETKTGRGLEDIAREKVFVPVGMRRTSYVWQQGFESDFAVGHNEKEDTLAKNRRKRANAAGSMETTIADFTRFLAAVMQGRGLSVRASGEMFRPQIAIHQKVQFPSLNTTTTTDNDKIELSYGLGWGVFKSSKGAVFFKEGHDDGWQHYCIGIPGEKAAYVFMTNSDKGEAIFTELARELAGVEIPWEWEGYGK
ncbi:MAG: beta-lactamase family protein [Bacteroidetes bacterium]|nr:beta-lactamase family protein [Bacteroidota bacterium]